MTITPDPQGWYALERNVDPAIVQQLAQLGPIEKLSLEKIPLITVKIARRLAGLRVDQLWLWCDVTRRAMQHIIQLPGLRVLDVLCIKGPGQMASFSAAADLEIVRANNRTTEADLLQIAQCAQLRELGVQGVELSYQSMSAILALPRLASLDLEATRFDDKMARQTSRSKTITSLEIGGTLITRKGLEHIVQMEQLQSLDLWSTTLNEMDLRLLLNLPHLGYLSLGAYDNLPPLNADEIVKLLLDCPSLKRVWLSGIQLETSQKHALESKLDSLRITSYDDAY